MAHIYMYTGKSKIVGVTYQAILKAHRFKYVHAVTG